MRIRESIYGDLDEDDIRALAITIKEIPTDKIIDMNLTQVPGDPLAPLVETTYHPKNLIAPTAFMDQGTPTGAPVASTQRVRPDGASTPLQALLWPLRSE